MFLKSTMNLRGSLIFFGLPGLCMFLFVHYLSPIMANTCIPPIVFWPLLIWSPIVVLLVVVLIKLNPIKDGYWRAERFWIKKMTASDVLIALAVFAGTLFLEFVLSPSGAWLATYSFFAVPEVIPDLFNPYLDIAGGLTQLFGVPLKGNWWLLGFWMGWVIVNIGCEEFLWRGYALPLQEKYFGKFAWLVNGLCWNLLIHWFMRWNVIALLPTSLLVPYFVQRYRNFGYGVIIHGLGNVLFFIFLIIGIVGG